MKVCLIEYPKCSTCQKAKKWLIENKITFEERNIVTQTPTKEELKSWMQKNDYEIKKWFNTSGLKYKELNLKERLIEMTDNEKVNLLISDGMLIKRPLLLVEDRVLIGFKKKEWSGLLNVKKV